MIKQLVCQLFSEQCQLKSLRLDISDEFINTDIHTCLASNSYLSSNFIRYQPQSCCMTLRRLFIRLNLKTCICGDMEFFYLKWLLNNLNYVEKLQVHLKSDQLLETRCQIIWKSVIDANFILEYCLPDKIINLIYFDFYIYSKCKLSLNDIEQIINSFKIHSFFISYQWTNVICLFDPIMSCQHLFSSFTNTLQFSDSIM
ncbi:unnamed protein product [Rotaria sp. Silwood1]|nr:unnamed protein product [Rotaria sp. Silwood1]